MAHAGVDHQRAPGGRGRYRPSTPGGMKLLMGANCHFRSPCHSRGVAPRQAALVPAARADQPGQHHPVRMNQVAVGPTTVVVSVPEASVSAQQFSSLFDALHNWGRWGSEQERALHLLLRSLGATRSPLNPVAVF